MTPSPSHTVLYNNQSLTILCINAENNLHYIYLSSFFVFFFFRLNSLEYRDLKEKLQAPVRNARNIVIKQSLSDQFLEAFREQVNENQVFRLPLNMVKKNSYDFSISLYVCPSQAKT